MDDALKQLIRISNTVGKDPALVQGGGGNTSVKTADGRHMYIKASGTALKDMNETRGWRRLNLAQTLAIIRDKSIAALPEQTREQEVTNRLLLVCDDNIKAVARPSVEAHLHALLKRCVIHLHPSAVGAFVNARNGKAHLEKLFADEKHPPLWVPYADPGYMLARRITTLVEAYEKEHRTKPAILFLEKHGLFVTDDNPNAALKLVHRVVARCNTRLKAFSPVKRRPVDIDVVNRTRLAIRKAFFDATGQYANVTWHISDSIAAFMKLKNAPRMLGAGVLTPDELVYANGPALWIEKPDAKRIAARLAAQIERGSKHAVTFLVKDVGLFIAGPEKIVTAVRDVFESSIFIRTNADRLGGISPLTKRQQQFINEWEAEAFRKTLAAGKSEGALKQRIAVVTGAGSGLGRSIAIGLARAGANVGLADIDIVAAAETQQAIKAELPGASAVVLPCNVADEASVEAAFQHLMDSFGGLDILVNAAGIAPPYALVDLPVEKWRQALEVNLTGYFLMAKAAARIMIAQGLGGSIINLSSKSGLEASKNNTPYNATKAGEIHMARGWALELGEHGIRVNSVAPGNVFEGSKIWNPEYIKVCARKYGIKPEEVIPYYVSKTALRKEIKGQDIADAIVFLCSDQARCITGQTLVADAGQVMVR
ncbi:MAG TPA: SDR family oxidoreductase [Anaerohalosphaeraceae bacterium]|jgi:NAD(P)-dependent dehydrogenase (short-subunit alcohol dehydrogenase family)/rhamnose utilization protein RhaD (predicted bifunctional aldolase and dehydrogenase)|nr:SDR family oxidoreductase [Anaerohalosphaeraceae bacterium]HRT50503.1 SDR family oxidoreductase [Anaerohalosphaeraceae bacterium]HRT86433.1 SDR family oxidoreductase [Anaerohalosphaeraceae bacterium]